MSQLPDRARRRPAARRPSSVEAVARLLALVALAAGVPSTTQAQTSTMGITAVPGIRVGHHTLDEPTGCTVVLADGGAIAAVDVRGGAPGTRETALLDPVNSVQTANAVVLSGGSAFGLESAAGVMRYLEERGEGYQAGEHVVPIVAAAILFDLSVAGGSVRPGPECGYRAAVAASVDAPAEGSVGVGAGATVGKLGGMSRAMKGGVGTASIALESGLVVAALVAVNAVGDVVDPATGRVVAGVRREDGRGFSDARRMLRGLAPDEAPGAGANTTIGVVATNALLSKSQTAKVAQMSHDGIARAIYPAHTPSDGDTMFALSTGNHEGEESLLVIGALAADVVAEAILRAVRLAEGIPGRHGPAIPSVGDLSTAR